MKKTLTRIVALALIAVMACLTLASCGGPAADPDKALEALKDNDYTAEKADDALSTGALALLGIKGVECIVSGVNEDGENITIFYFEDADDAKEAWDGFEDILEEFADEEEMEDSDWVCKKSGKMIYYGTKAGAKAAK